MIKETQQKKTTLDDSAEIYQPRKPLTEKQKLSEMTLKEKVTYFNDYYRFKTIIIVVSIIAIIYLGYSILAPKPDTVLYAAIINNALDTPAAETLRNEFGQHLSIDPETQNIMIDTSFLVGGDGNASEFSYASQQKLTTYLAAGEIDVIIAPESNFTQYAYYDNLSKLSDQLPTDLCSSLANSFYYSSTEEDSTKSAYGIYLDDATIYDDAGELIEKPVLGIVVNSNYKPNAIEFIRYLFQLY